MQGLFVLGHSVSCFHLQVYPRFEPQAAGLNECQRHERPGYSHLFKLPAIADANFFSNRESYSFLSSTLLGYHKLSALTTLALHSKCIVVGFIHTKPRSGMKGFTNWSGLQLRVMEQVEHPQGSFRFEVVRIHETQIWILNTPHGFLTFTQN